MKTHPVSPMTETQAIIAYRLSEKVLGHPWIKHTPLPGEFAALASGFSWEVVMADIVKRANLPRGFAWPQWTQLDEEFLRKFCDSFPLAREGALVASTDASRYTVNRDGTVVIDAHNYKSFHLAPNLRITWTPQGGADIYSHRDVAGRHLGTARAALRALTYAAADLGIEYPDGGEPSAESRRQSALWQTITTEAKHADLRVALQIASKAKDFLTEASDSYWQYRGGEEYCPLEEWNQRPTSKLVRDALEAVDAWHRQMVKEHDAQ